MNPRMHALLEDCKRFFTARVILKLIEMLLNSFIILASLLIANFNKTVISFIFIILCGLQNFSGFFILLGSKYGFKDKLLRFAYICNIIMISSTACSLIIVTLASASYLYGVGIYMIICFAIMLSLTCFIDEVVMLRFYLKQHYLLYQQKDKLGKSHEVNTIPKSEKSSKPYINVPNSPQNQTQSPLSKPNIPSFNANKPPEYTPTSRLDRTDRLPPKPPGNVPASKLNKEISPATKPPGNVPTSKLNKKISPASKPPGNVPALDLNKEISPASKPPGNEILSSTFKSPEDIHTSQITEISSLPQSIISNKKMGSRRSANTSKRTEASAASLFKSTATSVSNTRSTKLSSTTYSKSTTTTTTAPTTNTTTTTAPTTNTTTSH